MNKQIVEKIVEIAIRHEQTCQCELHLAVPRLTDKEFDAVRLLLNTQSGYSMLLGIVSHICAEDPDTYREFQRFVKDILNVNTGPRPSIN